VVLFASTCIEARRWKFYTEKMLPGSKSVQRQREQPQPTPSQIPVRLPK